MIKKIYEYLEEIFKNLGYDKEDLIINESNIDKIDYQINSVFKIAKKESKNPIEIGEKIVAEIKKQNNFGDYFEKLEFVKPGFINIVISDKLINTLLIEQSLKENDGIDKIKEPSTVVVDYGGPNIAKPLHVGHMRPAIIGQSIYNILKKVGYKTIGDVHLGDYGLQMGQVLYGILKENIKVEDLNIELLNRIYPSISGLCKTDEEVADECRKITVLLQDGYPEYQEYFKKIYEVSLNDIKRIYNYLSVDFDYWYGERDSFKYMEDLLAFLEEKKVVEVDDGAKIIRIQKEDDNKEMPPLILQGKSGAFLYSTSDVATIYQRMKDFNPNYILYVVDDRQKLHFEQVFRVCEKSSLTQGVGLEHNYFGTINGPDGKPFKTRSGDILRLDDLIKLTKENFISKKESNKNMSEEDIDKIVNAIIKFADLQNNREKNYIFDIDKFSDVNGKTGPYILYTALRINKIIKENSNINKNNFGNNIYNQIDRNLRIELLKLNEAINKAVDERMPHYIAEYVYNLSVITNNFYQNNNINNLQNQEQKEEWLNLLKLTYNTIQTCLGLLVIDIPSEM